MKLGGLVDMKKHTLYGLSLFGSLIVNIIFMQNGIFNVTQHLYYLPVLLGVFYYNKTGIYLAGLTSSFYIFTVMLFDYNNEIIISTLIRCVILIMIAYLVYSLLKHIKEQEKELLEEHKRLETTLLSIGDGIIATDTNGNIRMVNREAESITGLCQKDVENKDFSKMYPMYKNIDGEEVTYRQIEQVLQGSDHSIKDEVIYAMPDGSRKEIDIKLSPILLSEQECLGYVVVFRDVTEKKRIEAENIYLTYHDKLTGLYNRRFFEEEIQRLNIERSLPISIIIGDVNGLKLTNDAFGHLAGDSLLVKAGEVMREVCRESDIIARWGGDEYIILLPNTNLVEAEKITERIRRKSGETIVSNIALSISLGCATKTSVAEDLSAIIKLADDLMYKSKLLESRSIKSRAVQSILSTLQESNAKEGTHSIRVSKLCEEIGKALKLDKGEISDLILLGTIHDIGKASIDSNILNKHGKLTTEEYEMIKQHSEKGYHIVSASPDLSYLANYVLSHQERWDGTGYPSGIKGENIPYLSRILAVADAYEAMTCEKPYHKAFSKEEALAELERCRGTQFDPEIVAAFETIQ